ncbi:leucine-rich repeat domain-containing protein [Paenibacillus mendelii]|uniref:Leucine-rich repeat domain-containing protein n=1 Tax=Paenibacillus mendelii TaxID=206163 RepID=A0ABV6JG81_9BACL|nr:leucine-rich repeat domain-containing protein [Paenibacillus mendelii]MCQ6562382.1 hypothetical protein [Paenibacillus mendelii]
MKTTFICRKIILSTMIASLLASPVITLPAEAAAASTPQTDNAVLTFADPNLEASVRGAINKKDGVLRKNDVKNLQHLRIYNNAGIRSLNGIEQLTSLTTFALYDNPVTDITPITKMKSLKNVYFANLKGANYYEVQRMTWLEDLSLSNLDMDDISFLKPLNKLTSLSFTGNKVKDISVLSTMTGLTFLQAGWNEIEDISPLAKLPLRSLHLSSNKITDITPLTNMTQLFALQLEWNKIEDISLLAKFPNLYMLTLNSNPIASMLPVYSMTSKLTTKDFTLTDKDLTQTVSFPDKGLEEAVRKAANKSQGDLTLADVGAILSLDASGKSIRDLTGMELLPQLAEANFSNNQIKDITPLQHLTQLRTLRLKGNAIKNYAPLRDVYRGLTDKDFNPGYTNPAAITVSTFDELVKAAETTLEQPGKKVTITIKAPALQNAKTYSDMYSYLFTKYADTYGKYQYMSPTEVRKEKIVFALYAESAKYDKLTGTVNIEKTPFTFNAAQYEKPSVSDNMKPATSIQSNHADIQALAKEITNGLTTDMKKLEAIHDWVAANIQYDYATLQGTKNMPQDAVSVMRSKEAVCAGYSNLTAALGRAAGIPTQVVTGHIARFGSTWDKVLPWLFDRNYYHAWNQAYVDGKWIVLDTTWDAAQYADGKQTSAPTRSYFNPDPAVFASSHTYYAPKPTPDGLKEFYFQLSDADMKAVSDIAWQDVWKNEGGTGTFTSYTAAGHMLNGKATAIKAYRIPDGTYRVLTLERSKSGTWTIVSKVTKDNYLAPTPAYALKKY